MPTAFSTWTLDCVKRRVALNPTAGVAYTFIYVCIGRSIPFLHECGSGRLVATDAYWGCLETPVGRDLCVVVHTSRESPAPIGAGDLGQYLGLIEPALKSGHHIPGG